MHNSAAKADENIIHNFTFLGLSVWIRSSIDTASMSKNPAATGSQLHCLNYSRR